MEFFEAFIELFLQKILNFILKFIPIPKVKNKYLNGIITIIYWCVIGLGLGFILVGIIYLAVILIALIIAWVEKIK